MKASLLMGLPIGRACLSLAAMLSMKLSFGFTPLVPQPTTAIGVIGGITFLTFALRPCRSASLIQDGNRLQIEQQLGAETEERP